MKIEIDVKYGSVSVLFEAQRKMNANIYGRYLGMGSKGVSEILYFTENDSLPI